MSGPILAGQRVLRRLRKRASPGVRVTVSLARLCPMPQQVLWDLGAGSGAVSIEASLLMPGGQIWAVEKHPDRIAQILANRDRFGVPHMEVVQAVLPKGLSRLPDPDRVFIGGGGRNLTETIAVVCRRLATSGVVVVNTVLMDSLHDTVRCLRDHGLTTDVSQGLNTPVSLLVIRYS